MSSSEEAAYPILRKHDVDYVLVIFGGLIGHSGDDINKFFFLPANLFGGGQAMDRVRQQIVPQEGPTLDYLGLFFHAISILVYC